jgi:hypothetical protein
MQPKLLDHLKRRIDLLKTISDLGAGCDFSQLTVEELRTAGILSARTYGVLIKWRLAYPSAPIYTLATLVDGSEPNKLGKKSRQEIGEILEAAAFRS